MFGPKTEECKLITLHNEEPGHSYSPQRAAKVNEIKKNGLGI